MGASVLLLLPPSLTIRMEQRWELTPFLILLLLVAIGIDHLALASVFNDFKVSKSFDKIFLVSSERYAASVKKFVIDQNRPPTGQDIALVTQESNCQWALMYGQEFFTFYEGTPRTARCINSLDDMAALPSMSTRVYVSASDRELVDIIEDWRLKIERERQDRAIDAQSVVPVNKKQ